MKHYLVYQTTNRINGKVYIGAHTTKNKNDSYFGSGTLIISAIAKYGKENFTRTILHECKSKEEMFELEIKEIAKAKEAGLEIYNLHKGGSGSWDSIPIPDLRLTMKSHHKEGRITNKMVIANGIKGAEVNKKLWASKTKDERRVILNGRQGFIQPLSQDIIQTRLGILKTIDLTIPKWQCIASVKLGLCRTAVLKFVRAYWTGPYYIGKYKGK